LARRIAGGAPVPGRPRALPSAAAQRHLQAADGAAVVVATSARPRGMPGAGRPAGQPIPAGCRCTRRDAAGGRAGARGMMI